MPIETACHQRLPLAPFRLLLVGEYPSPVLDSPLASPDVCLALHAAPLVPGYPGRRRIKMFSHVSVFTTGLTGTY